MLDSIEVKITLSTGLVLYDYLKKLYDDHLFSSRLHLHPVYGILHEIFYKNINILLRFSTMRMNIIINRNKKLVHLSGGLAFFANFLERL